MCAFFLLSPPTPPANVCTPCLARAGACGACVADDGRQAGRFFPSFCFVFALCVWSQKKKSKAPPLPPSLPASRAVVSPAGVDRVKRGSGGEGDRFFAHNEKRGWGTRKEKEKKKTRAQTLRRGTHRGNPRSPQGATTCVSTRSGLCEEGGLSSGRGVALCSLSHTRPRSRPPPPPPSLDRSLLTRPPAAPPARGTPAPRAA